MLPGQTPRLVVPMGHTKEIASIAFSPDGKYVLTGSWDHTAKLWDLAGHELLTFSGHEGPVLSVAFSPDGQYILTGSEDATAKLWDLSGHTLRSLSGHDSWVFSVAFSPDGQAIITGSRDRTAKIWSLAGRLLQTLAGHDNPVLSVAFSPNGQQALTGISNNTAKLWDIKTGTVIQQFSGHNGPVEAVAFSPDGQKILTGSNDKTAKLWETSSGKALQDFVGHTEPVWQAIFSPDGQQVLTSSGDYTAKRWDLNTGQMLQNYAGHAAPVRAAAFSPNGQQLLTGCKDGTAKLWDLQGRELRTFLSHAATVESVAYSPDSQHIMAGSNDGTARVWDMQGRELRVLTGHNGFIESVAFSPNGEQVLTGSRDGTVKLWDRKTGAARRTFPGRSAVRAVAFSPDGQKVLTGGWDKLAKLWDIHSDAPIQTFAGHADAVWSVAFSRDGQQVLTGSRDQTAKLWDIHSGDTLRTFIGHQNPVISVAFSPNGKSILTGGWDGNTRLWGIDSGQVIQAFAGKADAIRAAALSPDGLTVLTGDREGEVMLWGLSGREPRQLAGHADAISAAAFSPNGRVAMTAGTDRTIKLWNTQTGKEIATLVAIDLDDWVVTTPAGLFDASPGAMRLMHFAVGLEAVELEQLKERYFEPGLLAKLLGMSLNPLRSVQDFDAVALYPEMSATLTADKQSVQVNLKPRNGGMGKLSVFVNGKEMVEDANPERNEQLRIDLSKFTAYYLPDEPNRVSLRVYNEDGWLKSMALNLEYTPPANPNERRTKGLRAAAAPAATIPLMRGKPSLYAVVIGTANYASEQLKLQFADLDAAAFSQALQAAAPKIFEERVDVTLLNTDVQALARHDIASKATIAKAFADIAAKAKAQDILIVYFSGHGVTYGTAEQAQFYYLTKDIASENLSDPEIRHNYAISSEELTEWIKAIPALKQVMVADACNAGQIVEDLFAGRKDLNTTQVRALDRMKDRTGMFILAGSAADKASYEASQYGQGLLTFSLLQGMSGLALTEDKRVDVMTLFQYARDQVPELARGIGGVQKPVPHFPPDGSSFDIGIVDESVKIPVAQVKPVFIRNQFQNDATFGDDLKLNQALADHFRSITGKGTEAQLIYVDVSNYAYAYSIRGRYTVKRGKVSVRGRLFRGDQAVGSELSASGKTNALPALVKNIADRAWEMAK